MHSIPPLFPAKPRGFTLLELLVTTALIMLTVGVIVVNYNNYNENQRVKQAGLLLKTNLRYVQTKAFSAEKPAGCTNLTGYTVTFTATNYSYVATCESFAGPTPTPVSVALAPGLSFTVVPSAPVQFQVLTRGVNVASDVLITINGPVRNYRLQVTTSGNINDLGFQ